MSASPESFVPSEAASFNWKRQAPRPEDEHLLALTQNWLGTLPKGVRPIHLQDKFPRIANELSRIWLEPAALDHYFEEKEFSPRIDRLGFPPVIKEELLCMHLYSLRNRSTPNKPSSPQQASLLG